MTSELDEGLLWPDPPLQLNPAFEPGGCIDELVDRGELHPECGRIFRTGKQPGADSRAERLRLHRHQAEAIRAARAGRNYVLTTGTGSGKSLSYIVSIVDYVLRTGTGDGRIKAIVVYPMNALANSQEEELRKFLSHGYPDGNGPVTFRRFTGQESEDERDARRQRPRPRRPAHAAALRGEDAPPLRHRYGDYAMRAEGSQDTQLPDVPVERLDDPAYAPLPRYWVDESEVRARLAGRWERDWLLGWRDICRSTDERMVIASFLPRVAVGHTTPLFLSRVADLSAVASLAGVLSSLAFDYVARQTIGGTHLTYGFLNQLPIPTPDTFSAPVRFAPPPPLTDWLLPRVLELSYTADDLTPFARDLDYDGPPFHWDSDRRFLLRAELDAAFFHLYGIERDDVDYILDTFPIVRRNDERAHGEFRTKRVILEVSDTMAQAAASGGAYETRLDPPPADLAVAHGVPAGVRQ